MVVVEAIGPLMDRQEAALRMLTMRSVCEHCVAGLIPVKMRGGRQYVHYDRDERLIVVCTEARP